SNVHRVNLPGDVGVVEKLEDGLGREMVAGFGQRMKEALRSRAHGPQPHDGSLQRRRSVEAVRGGELRREPVGRIQVVAIIKAHGAFAFDICCSVVESEESTGVNEAVEQQWPVGRIETVHGAPSLLPCGRVVEDAAGSEMEVTDKR